MPTGVPAVGSPEFLIDPYPTYASLRQHNPYFDESLGHWVVTRFDDVSAVLANPRLSSAGRVHALLRQALPDRLDSTRWIGEHFDRTLPFLQPPRHGLIRSLLVKVLTPRHVEGMRPGIERLVATLLDETPASEIDLAETLTLPLPMAVISLLLDVPPGNEALFVTWTRDLFSIFGPASSLPDNIDRVSVALRAMADYMGDLVRERSTAPGDDVISLLLAARDDEGRRLTAEEVVSNCITMYTAGHETTQGLLGNGLLALAMTPGATDRVRRERALLPRAIEEMLRYDSPLQRGWRVATAAVEVGGSAIPTDALVAFFIGAANRDPSRFPEPDRFNVERHPNRHLAFGHGPHFCIGAGLARLEAEVAVGAVLDRFDQMTVVGEPVRRWDMAFRVLEALPVSVSRSRD